MCETIGTYCNTTTEARAIVNKSGLIKKHPVLGPLPSLERFLCYLRCWGTEERSAEEMFEDWMDSNHEEVFAGDYTGTD